MTALRTTMALLAFSVPLGLGACAPTKSNTPTDTQDIGRTAQISYGVIVSMRTVTVQAANTGVGTVLGAVAGAVAGGLAGNAIEQQAGSGPPVEFIIQEDNATQPISVMQTNEEHFHPGERIVLTRGDRTRITRVGA